jgi:hypothetical protein
MLNDYVRAQPVYTSGCRVCPNSAAVQLCCVVLLIDSAKGESCATDNYGFSQVLFKSTTLIKVDPKNDNNVPLDLAIVPCLAGK